MNTINVQPIIEAKIKYYAVFEFINNSGKTPKYKINKSMGVYAPMKALENKKGEIIMYLMQQRNENSNTPQYYLQAKNSLNFTGLKDYFINNKPSIYAYGYPNSNKTYSKENKTNPFYCNRDDAFLFVIYSKDGGTPYKIELLVIGNGRNLISWHIEALKKGGYDDILKKCRETKQDETKSI